MGKIRPPRVGLAAAIMILAIFLCAQLVPVDRGNPSATEWVEAPPPIREVLDRSCIDCHSNQTEWPWYSKIAPVSWLIAYDVREGRYALNFSAWDEYDEDERIDLLDRVGEEVRADRMPPWPYLLLHPEAATDPEIIELLSSWREAVESH